MPLLFEFQRRRRRIFTLSMGMNFFVKIKKSILREKMLRAKSDKKIPPRRRKLSVQGRFFSLWKQFPSYEKTRLGEKQGKENPFNFLFCGKTGVVGLSFKWESRGGLFLVTKELLHDEKRLHGKREGERERERERVWIKLQVSFGLHRLHKYKNSVEKNLKRATL